MKLPKADLTCSDICKNCIGGECLNLKTVSPESADSLDDDVLDDALQVFNDDSDTETFAGKIKYKNFAKVDFALVYFGQS